MHAFIIIIIIIIIIIWDEIHDLYFVSLQTMFFGELFANETRKLVERLANYVVYKVIYQFLAGWRRKFFGAIHGFTGNRRPLCDKSCRGA